MEFCHGIQPVRQPQPSINGHGEGGDCFACAVLAMLKFFTSNESLDFEYVIKLFTTKTSSGTSTLLNHWAGYDTVLSRVSWGCEDYGLKPLIKLEYRKHIPLNPMYGFEYHNFSWGRNLLSASDYFWQVDAFLRAGYVLLVETDVNARGPLINEEGKVVQNHTNHVVLIDGVKCGWEDHPTVECAKSLKEYLHIIDSNLRFATNEYWVSVDDLIEKYGASGFYMVRPREY